LTRDVDVRQPVAGEDVFGRCFVDRAEGWRLSPAWAGSRAAFLALESDGKSVQDWFNPDKPRVELWFEKNSRHVLLCRYLATEGVCSDMLQTVEFELSEGRWQARTIMELVCVT
jgi:hypothetical protein